MWQYGIVNHKNENMKKTIFYPGNIRVFLLFWLVISFLPTASGQIYLHNFGTVAISAHPYTVAPGILDANLSASSWSNSKSAWTSYAGSGGQALSLSNSSGSTTITLTFLVASGCQMSVSTFSFWRQRSSSGAQNWSMTINGIAVGSGTVPTSGASTGNLAPTNTISGLSGTITVVISLSGASGTGTFRLDDFTLNGTVSTLSSNTISTGVVSGAPFSVNCSSTATGSVAFTSSGSFLANTYTAQLSNASGSFTSPVNIGTLLSDANSGSINITIPAATVTGSGYRIRVVSSSPGATGSSSAAFSINLSGGPCSCFEIRSILVDACNGTNEGENEMFRFVVGGADINTSDISVSWPSNSRLGFCQDATTASIVSNINATITGGGQLIEPIGGVIPAGSQVMFFTSTDFYYTLFDFSLLNYDLYVIFQCAGNTAGHFANYTGSGTRTLNMNVDACGSDAVTYNCGLLYHGDGATVDFDVPGNPTYSLSGSCSTVPLFGLPVELISFKAECASDAVQLTWITATETNNNYFSIEASNDGDLFTTIATVQGAGNSNELREYGAVVEKGAVYYRLKQTDFDGNFSYPGIVSVICEDKSISLFPTLVASGTPVTITGEVERTEVFDTHGRAVFPDIYDNTIYGLAPGMYFVIVNNSETFRIVVE